jgi:hypothetical protein
LAPTITETQTEALSALPASLEAGKAGEQVQPRSDA